MFCDVFLQVDKLISLSGINFEPTGWLNVMDLPAKLLEILEMYTISKIITKGLLTVKLNNNINLNLQKDSCCV